MLQADILEKRYTYANAEKASGATYTPTNLADFVAEKIVEGLVIEGDRILHLLDPAIGAGELMLSLLRKLNVPETVTVIAHGFDTDTQALNQAYERINESFPKVQLHLYPTDFVDFAFSNNEREIGLFTDESHNPKKFDIVIANPPYVRTQIMGAIKSKELASRLSLSGRVDLYHAFLAGIVQVLKPGGKTGIIVSNRFMTTKGGDAVRELLYNGFSLRHIWDLGDTKLFNAAVLPAVILAEGSGEVKSAVIQFSKIYATEEEFNFKASNPIMALSMSGTVGLPDGRKFHVQHGVLDRAGKDNLWRIATDHSDSWLSTVKSNTWGTFRDIGKIRVGVKTCADKVYIRSDWGNLSEQPELLRPLTTHHSARRFRAIVPKNIRLIVYPHEVVDGRRRAISLAHYPRTRQYLEKHRKVLEARTYVTESGRKWYEIWVPQDPDAWKSPKLVFRDISDKPTFWLDLDGSVVNGDCYWIIPENIDNEPLLWLAAAVANSTFSESFYDHRFNNKLYAGRRRFITQYVEQFPLPNPHSIIGQEIITFARNIYNSVGTPEFEMMEKQLNEMVWRAFGLSVEEGIT
jgi:adenine-specific DNA-methyltransferase